MTGPRRMTALLTAAMLVLGVVASAAPSAARTSRWIVFAASPQSGTQPTQLFRVRTDGTGLRQLTSGRPASQPSFSPDGRRIAYARFDAGISMIGLDGTGRHRVTRASDTFPVWSPDGERIAFVRGDRLAVMTASGRRQHLLARAPRRVGRPSWTADSRAIIVPVEGDLAVALYEVDAFTGRVLKRFAVKLDEPNATAVPTVSPDGRPVAFVGADPDGGGCLGYSCEPDGLYAARLSLGTTRLLDGAGAVPAGWSPDGHTLVGAHGYELELYPLRGGPQTFISTGTNAVAGDAPPAWQPRG